MQSNNSYLLANKIVVVIGGAGLLGKVFCEAIVTDGATVVVADINLSRAEQVCQSIAERYLCDRIVPESVDFTSKTSLQSLIARISERFGSIDAVVNNAYPRNTHYGRKLEDIEYTDFCENVSMHLGGYFLSTQQFAIFFKRQGYGQVVNMSSIYGSSAPRFEIYDGTTMTMPAEYAAIKSGIQQLSLYFMRYYKGTRLRFNCISPGGIIDTQPEAFKSAYGRYSQSKGMLAPEDISGALTFLLSDRSQYINGQNLVIDDGWSK